MAPVMSSLSRRYRKWPLPPPPPCQVHLGVKVLTGRVGPDTIGFSGTPERTTRSSVSDLEASSTDVATREVLPTFLPLASSPSKEAKDESRILKVSSWLAKSGSTWMLT